MNAKPESQEVDEIETPEPQPVAQASPLKPEARQSPEPVQADSIPQGGDAPPAAAADPQPVPIQTKVELL